MKIRTELWITTGQSKFEICDCLERIITNSILGNHEFKLTIEETKVIDEI